MSTRTPRERDLEAVADALGMTVAQVDQLEQRALRKLRRWLEAHGLTLADFVDAPEPQERGR